MGVACADERAVTETDTREPVQGGKCVPIVNSRKRQKNKIPKEKRRHAKADGNGKENGLAQRELKASSDCGGTSKECNKRNDNKWLGIEYGTKIDRVRCLFNEIVSLMYANKHYDPYDVKNSLVTNLTLAADTARGLSPWNGGEEAVEEDVEHFSFLSKNYTIGGGGDESQSEVRPTGGNEKWTLCRA